jgi:hypothetical protein
MKSQCSLAHRNIAVTGIRLACNDINFDVYAPASKTGTGHSSHIKANSQLLNQFTDEKNMDI